MGGPGVIGLGAGGHARVVIDILRIAGQYEVVGLLDQDPGLRGTSVLGVPILGGDEEIPELKARGIEQFFIGVGSTSLLEPRQRLYGLAVRLGMKAVAAIHPRSVVSSDAFLGPGPTIMALAVINPGARLGENVIVNTGAIVEHDCIIGNHVHIATAATLAGTVVVGDGTHIGAGAVVRQGIRIGSRALVGAGAVVIRDVADGETVVGNPARPWKREVK